MHDLSYFREHLELFAEMAKRRNITLDLESFRVFDRERRELITQTEALKAKRNKASDEIARLKKEKADASALLAEMAGVSKQIKEADERIASEGTQVAAQRLPEGRSPRQRHARHLHLCRRRQGLGEAPPGRHPDSHP